MSASAGISDRREFSDKDVLIREADFALLTAKRSGQDAVIYTSEMEALATTADAGDERHARTLANALALAVDAKDSYTRSHSQTVSQLSAVIATELGFEPGASPRCVSPDCCTTSARSGSPTRSSTSPPTSPVASTSR